MDMGAVAVAVSRYRHHRSVRVTKRKVPIEAGVPWNGQRGACFVICAV